MRLCSMPADPARGRTARCRKPSARHNWLAFQCRDGNKNNKNRWDPIEIYGALLKSYFSSANLVRRCVAQIFSPISCTDFSRVWKIFSPIWYTFSPVLYADSPIWCTTLFADVLRRFFLMCCTDFFADVLHRFFADVLDRFFADVLHRYFADVLQRYFADVLHK